MVVEVAETSLDRDRNKRRLYARAGIDTYWILNIPSREVEYYCGPLSGESADYAE